MYFGVLHVLPFFEVDLSFPFRILQQGRSNINIILLLVVYGHKAEAHLILARNRTRKIHPGTFTFVLPQRTGLLPIIAQHVPVFRAEHERALLFERRSKRAENSFPTFSFERRCMRRSSSCEHTGIESKYQPKKEPIF